MFSWRISFCIYNGCTCKKKNVFIVNLKNFSFLLTSLGRYWLINLYRFQVHNSTTYHLCTLYCVFTTSQGPVRHHLSPHALLHASPPPPTLPVTTLSVSFSLSLLLVQSFHLCPSPPLHPAPSCQPAVYEPVSIGRVSLT